MGPAQCRLDFCPSYFSSRLPPLPTRCFQHMAHVGAHRVYDDELQGAIFDVDGTLLDSMPLFFPSWVATGALPQFDLTFTEEYFYSVGGWPLKDIVRVAHERQRGTVPSDEFVAAFLEEKLQVHRAHEAEHPAAISQVVALAKAYKERGIPVAIATSGVEDIVMSHLAHAGIDDLVSRVHMVFAADVKRGKPDPAIYIEAARRLDVDPRFCRAYEDAESGLQSAYEAGMEVIDVTFMSEYPCPQALRDTKGRQIEKRTWVRDSVDSVVPSNSGASS
uniref:Uncharacterized protein n=1 Tax=Noctiluca scintillans TaxID=2966 RepID=A0A7S1FHB9_NOCSC